MQDRLRLWLWDLFRFEESGTEVSQLSFIKLPRLVIDTRAKELAFKFAIEHVTLSQKKRARSRLRLRQCVTNTPVSLKLRERIVTPLQPVFDLLLTVAPDVRKEVRQVIRSTRS